MIDRIVLSELIRSATSIKGTRLLQFQCFKLETEPREYLPELRRASAVRYMPAMFSHETG